STIHRPLTSVPWRSAIDAADLRQQQLSLSHDCFTGVEPRSDYAFGPDLALDLYVLNLSYIVFDDKYEGTGLANLHRVRGHHDAVLIPQSHVGGDKRAGPE